MIRVSAFDLGTEGAVFRAKLDRGVILPLSCERWNWSKIPEERRYHEFKLCIETEAKWADVLGYELIQFNRGKSIIEGCRGILLAAADERGIMCHGINTSTLKSFASPPPPKKKGQEARGQADKNDMRVALATEWPDFAIKILNVGKKTDDIVDAAWVAIWVLSHVETDHV